MHFSSTSQSNHQIIRVCEGNRNAFKSFVVNRIRYLGDGPVAKDEIAKDVSRVPEKCGLVAVVTGIQQLALDLSLPWLLKVSLKVPYIIII